MARFNKKSTVLKVIRKDIPAHFYRGLEESTLAEIEEFLVSGVLRHINVPLLARRNDLFKHDENETLRGFMNIGNVVGYDDKNKTFKVEIFEKYSDFIESANFKVFASVDVTRGNWKVTRLNVFVPVERPNQETEQQAPSDEVESETAAPQEASVEE